MNERERNRQQFPQLAGLVDAFRKEGFEVKLLAGIENGREIGAVDDALRNLGEDWM